MTQLQIQFDRIDTVHLLKFVMSVCACVCVLVGNYKSSISDSRASVEIVGQLELEFRSVGISTA